MLSLLYLCFFFFFQAEDGIRDLTVTGVQTCALPIFERRIDLERLANKAQGLVEIVVDEVTDGDAVRDLDKARSEEHTSELQSQSNLVCRLLLEKKKRRNYLSIAACLFTSSSRPLS